VARADDRINSALADEERSHFEGSSDEAPMTLARRAFLTGSLASSGLLLGCRGGPEDSRSLGDELEGGVDPPFRSEQGEAASTLPPEQLRTAELTRGPTDVTFLVISDLHFGSHSAAGPLRPVLLAAIREMNAIEGKPYPRAIGGRVGAVSGVLVAGDLTEDGRPAEWTEFVETMGLRGESALRHPVFESYGNHDEYTGQVVRAGVTQRHGAGHYALSWGGLRVYCLGDGANEERRAWLAHDLDRLPKEANVVVYQHFPMRGAWSTGQWFGDGDHRTPLRKTLDGRNVRAIFHGHNHETGHYRWGGHDTYLAGSPKHSWRNFLVVHVTDERTTVAAYHYERKSWWWWHDRPRAAETPPYFPAGTFARA
jgi:hypothetical protein